MSSISLLPIDQFTGYKKELLDDSFDSPNDRSGKPQNPVSNSITLAELLKGGEIDNGLGRYK